MNTHNHLLRNGQAYLFLSLPRHSVLYNNNLSYCLSQILLLPLLNVTFFNSSQILHYFQIINFFQNCWAFMNPEFIFSTAAIIWNTFYPSHIYEFLWTKDFSPIFITSLYLHEVSCKYGQLPRCFNDSFLFQTLCFDKQFLSTLFIIIHIRYELFFL